MKRTDYIARVYHYFKFHPLWLRIVEWTKTHSLPGLSRIPIYNLLIFIEKETKEENLNILI